MSTTNNLLMPDSGNGQRFALLFACGLLTANAWARENPEINQPMPDPVATYLTAIDRAEAEHGAYANELGDLYLSLGQSFLKLENYEEAKVAFQRGLQLQRINYGLNSLEQTPYLFSIADIESKIGTWASTEAVLENIHHVSINSFEANDPKVLPVLDQLLKWYLVDYRTRTSGDGYLNLRRAEDLALEMAQVIENQNGLGHPETTKVLRQVGHLHYFMAEHLNAQGEAINPRRDFNSSPTTPGLATRPPIIEELMRAGIRNFDKLIQSVNLQPGATKLDQAHAIAKLGDWHLIFGQRQTATKSYQLAYQILASGNPTENLADQIFGQPTLVDFSDDENEIPNRIPGVDEFETIQVSMTVSNSGRPEDITVLDPPERLEKQQINRIQRGLRTLAFRPRLADGKPVQTEQFILEYPLTDAEMVQ